jgi:hypothetical protein
MSKDAKEGKRVTREWETVELRHKQYVYDSADKAGTDQQRLKNEHALAEFAHGLRVRRWLLGLIGIGFIFLVWERFDEKFSNPLIWGNKISGLLILIGALGIAGRELIAPIADAIKKFGKP